MWVLAAYRGSPDHVWVLLVEVLLELGQLVEVPVLLPQPLAGVPVLPAATPATTSPAPTTEPGRPAAVPGEKDHVRPVVAGPVKPGVLLCSGPYAAVSTT